jgi:hypothetical protein
MSSVRNCRFLIEVDGVFKKVCRIVFAQNDASLYFFPYGCQDRYFWGEGLFPEGKEEETFTHSNEVGSQDKPKLSIHESGQVHVKLVQSDAYKAGPLQTKPPWEFRGEHLAGLTIDNLRSLPGAGKIKSKPKSPELAPRAKDLEHTRRFAIYANGEEPRFVYPVKVYVTMFRSGLPAPLHIGITTFKQESLTQEDPAGGVTIISGWNPDNENQLVEERFLWVRAI